MHMESCLTFRNSVKYLSICYSESAGQDGIYGATSIKMDMEWRMRSVNLFTPT